MQYLILLVLIISTLLISSIIYNLIKHNRIRLLLRSIVIIILLGICVWYFIPTKYHLPAIEELNINVYNHSNNTELEISDLGQKQELYVLLSKLSARRPFFYNFGNTMGSNDFAIVFVDSKTPDKNNDFNLALIVSLADTDFNGRKIYCSDLQKSIVLNPQELITYIEDLASTFS